jgi:hypothetical protein
LWLRAGAICGAHLGALLQLWTEIVKEELNHKLVIIVQASVGYIL